jgi:hypothetical protein
MKSDITIQSFYAGLLLFGLCFAGMMINLGSFVVIVSHFLPGLIFGFVLVQHTPHPVSLKNKILFVFLSTGIYIACVFFVDVANEEEIWTPLKLITGSAIGAVLLALAYDFLIVNKINFTTIVLLPLAIGIAASVLSAFCIYYMHRVDLDQILLNNLLWAGIFSIFPFWFYLFARHIKLSQMKNKNV